DWATTPAALTSPKVGLMPATPQNAEGSRIDPAVSVPIEKAAKPAASAAPEPPEDPPAIRSRPHGLRVRACVFCVLTPKANSCVLTFPSSTGPAAVKRVTSVASLLGTQSARIVEPAVVRIPPVATTSFKQ